MGTSLHQLLIHVTSKENFTPSTPSFEKAVQQSDILRLSLSELPISVLVLTSGDLKSDPASDLGLRVES